MALAVASVTGTNFGAATTAHACTLPATINAGDLLIVALGWPTTTTSVSATDSTGDPWTRLEAGAINQAANLAVFAKIAHGDEGGGTVGVTTGAAEDASGAVYRITGFIGTLADDIDITAKITGTADGNPGAVTAGWGSDANLFIVFCVLDNNEPVDANPANYTEGYEVVDAGVDHTFWTGYRLLTAASDDPGTIGFTDADALDDWAAFTLVVGPQGGSPPPEEGSISGSISWVGTITGTRVSSGALSGAISWAGTIDGKRTAKGELTGAIGWAGSITGKREPKGALNGGIAWDGVIDGEAPVLAQGGELIGAIGWAGTITGARASQGSLAGAIGWVGTIDGEAPLLLQSGELIGAITWDGEITGVAVHEGSLVGVVTWSGVIEGGHPIIAAPLDAYAVGPGAHPKNVVKDSSELTSISRRRYGSRRIGAVSGSEGVGS